MEQSRVVVAASNKAGLEFVKLLLHQKIPVAALTNNKKEEQLLRQMGVQDILRVRTTRGIACGIPDFLVKRVLIFEASLPLSCQYLQLVSQWSCQQVTVVTSVWHPEGIYKKLGAAYVIYSRTGNVVFLLGQMKE